MKTSNLCPKCESNQIIRLPGFISGNRIRLAFILPGLVNVTRYLCTDCGYSEEWIDKPQDVQRLKEKYGVIGSGVGL